MVVLVAVLCLVAALAMDPGSGTGTNLQPAADVGGLVVGDHHAKPMPTVVSLVALVAALAAAALHAVSAITPVSEPGGVGRVPDEPGRHASLAAGWRSTRARRGPPAA